MITRTAPIDYHKRILIVSQLVRICAMDGHNTFIDPATGKRTCMACKSTETVEVYEHELEEARENIKALALVAELAPQAAELFRGLTAISYLRGDEPAERW